MTHPLDELALDEYDHPEHGWKWMPLELRWIRARDLKVWNLAMETAMKKCEELDALYWKAWKAKYDPDDQGKSDGATECAAAIKELMK